MRGHHHTKRFVFCRLGVMSVSDIQTTGISILLAYLCICTNAPDPEGGQRKGQTASVLRWDPATDTYLKGRFGRADATDEATK